MITQKLVNRGVNIIIAINKLIFKFNAHFRFQQTIDLSNLSRIKLYCAATVRKLCIHHYVLLEGEQNGEYFRKIMECRQSLSLKAKHFIEIENQSYSNSNKKTIQKEKSVKLSLKIIFSTTAIYKISKTKNLDFCIQNTVLKKWIPHSPTQYVI